MDRATVSFAGNAKRIQLLSTACVSDAFANRASLALKIGRLKEYLRGRTKILKALSAENIFRQEKRIGALGNFGGIVSAQGEIEFWEGLIRAPAQMDLKPFSLWRRPQRDECVYAGSVSPKDQGSRLNAEPLGRNLPKCGFELVEFVLEAFLELSFHLFEHRLPAVRKSFFPKPFGKLEEPVEQQRRLRLSLYEGVQKISTIAKGALTNLFTENND